MWQIAKRIQILTLLFSGLAGSFPVLAVPGHFSSTIGSALLCQDQIDSFYFNDYMTTYFGKPTKVEGGANWWKVSSVLFGAKVDSIFVSQVNISSVFIGAIFVDAPDVLRQKIQDATGVTYQATNNPEQWNSPSFSLLLKYNSQETPSKLFCLK